MALRILVAVLMFLIVSPANADNGNSIKGFPATGTVRGETFSAECTVRVVTFKSERIYIITGKIGEIGDPIYYQGMVTVGESFRDGPRNQWWTMGMDGFKLVNGSGRGHDYTVATICGSEARRLGITKD